MTDLDPENIPDPAVDDDPDPGNAAGGVDAVDHEQPIPPLSADVPLSAQVDDDAIPDAVKQPEQPDTDATVDDPSVEPSA